MIKYYVTLKKVGLPLLFQTTQ